MQKTRAGVVGVGQMGQYHVGIYSELHDIELVGVADTDRQRGAYVAGKYDIPLYTDYRDLLGKVDVVSIAIPTSLHYPIAKTFLEAGVHVLLEKPIAHTMEEATELFRIADTQRVALHIGHVERFNGAIQELKNIVHEPLRFKLNRLFREYLKFAEPLAANAAPFQPRRLALLDVRRNPTSVGFQASADFLCGRKCVRLATLADSATRLG